MFRACNPLRPLAHPGTSRLLTHSRYHATDRPWAPLPSRFAVGFALQTPNAARALTSLETSGDSCRGHRCSAAPCNSCRVERRLQPLLPPPPLSWRRDACSRPLPVSEPPACSPWQRRHAAWIQRHPAGRRAGCGRRHAPPARRRRGSRPRRLFCGRARHAARRVRRVASPRRRARRGSAGVGAAGGGRAFSLDHANTRDLLRELESGADDLFLPMAPPPAAHIPPASFALGRPGPGAAGTPGGSAPTTTLPSTPPLAPTGLRWPAGAVMPAYQLPAAALPAAVPVAPLGVAPAGTPLASMAELRRGLAAPVPPSPFMPAAAAPAAKPPASRCARALAVGRRPRERRLQVHALASPSPHPACGMQRGASQQRGQACRLSCHHLLCGAAPRPSRGLPPKPTHPAAQVRLQLRCAVPQLCQTATRWQGASALGCHLTPGPAPLHLCPAAAPSHLVAPPPCCLGWAPSTRRCRAHTRTMTWKVGGCGGRCMARGGAAVLWRQRRRGEEQEERLCHAPPVLTSLPAAAPPCPATQPPAGR